MAPKNKSPVKKAERTKNVMNLAQKMKVIQLLENNEKIATIARRFMVNESTIRSIRNNKEKIKQSASALGPNAKFCKISRDGNFLI